MWKMKHRIQAPEGGEGGGGGGNTPWYGALPADAAPEFSQWIANKNFPDAQTALQSSYNLEKLFGADKAGRAVIWPKDANDAEGWKGIYSRLGVPADATGYKVPDALKDDPLIGSFAKVAHSMNIPASAFEGVVTEMLKAASELDTKSQNDAKAASAKDLDKLKAEWGTDFDKNAEFGRRYLREAGWDDAKITRYEQTFGTATMLKDFHQWGTKISEHGFVKGDGAGGMTPQKQAVQKQVDTLKQRRIAGDVSDAQYHAEMAVLGPQLEAA